LKPEKISSAQEIGKSRLENWALWARLDSSDTGYPKKCAYYEPGRAVNLEFEADEPLPYIDHAEAEAVDALIVRLGYSTITLLKMRYGADRRRQYRRCKMSDIAKELHYSFQKACDELTAAELSIGRASSWNLGDIGA